MQVARPRMASDEADMLRSMGLRGIDDLFSDIPPSVRMKALALPAGLPEQEVVARITEILSANRAMADMPTFLGAGLYDHFIPAAVRAITSRAEFYTAYTPYQPEVSQGMLQTLWEYQSMICELTGMDAANTSMYDASTALGEAARMARRIHGGKIFLVPRALRWHRRSVLQNYTWGGGLKAVVWVDLLQLCIYLFGAVATLWAASRLAGGFGHALARASALHKLRVVDFHLSLTEPYTLLGGLVGGAMLSAASHGTDHLMVQRLLATRSLRDARRAIVGSGVVVITQFAVFLLVGTLLWAAGADTGTGSGGHRPIPARASRRQSNSSPGSDLRSGATSEWPSTRAGSIGWRRTRSRQSSMRQPIRPSRKGR